MAETRIERAYTQSEIDEGLLAMYLAGGSSVQASKITQIPESTLRSWRDSRHERYAELAKQYAPQLEEKVVRKLEEALVAGAAATLQAIEYASSAIESADVKDAAKAAKDLAQATGTVTDKLLTLQGRPNLITQNQDASEILRALKQRVPWLVVDGTAQEITPYELTPPSTENATESASWRDSRRPHARAGNEAPSS